MSKPNVLTLLQPPFGQPKHPWPVVALTINNIQRESTIFIRPDMIGFPSGGGGGGSPWGRATKQGEYIYVT